MNAINIGMSGSYMHSLSVDVDDPKSFAQSILPQNISSISNADYMTICYGLNETNHEIGTKDDSSLSTIWGAWNTSLSSIFDVNPAIKVGIIIADSWMNQRMHNALSSIAYWWGIPYLDLKDGPTSMIGGRLDNTTLNPYVIDRRNSVFKVAVDNGHPT